MTVLSAFPALLTALVFMKQTQAFTTYLPTGRMLHLSTSTCRYRYSALRHQVDDMTLTQLLEELDRLDVVYSPASTRKDLKNLLMTKKQEDKNTGNSVSAAMATDRSCAPRTSNQQYPDRSVRDLIKELDRREVCYPPTATRSDLEALLGQTESDSIRGLIQELDQLDIRYPPTARRSDLERLLREHKSRKPRSTKGFPQRSIREILQELDEREIRYAPNASRQELEELLLQKPVEEVVSEATKESGSLDLKKAVVIDEDSESRKRSARSAVKTSTSSLQERLEKRQRRQRASRPPSTIQTVMQKSVSFTTSSLRNSRLPRKVLDQVQRQTRRASRNLQDFLTVDEDGVREPVWYYHERNNEDNFKGTDVVVDVETVSGSGNRDDVVDKGVQDKWEEPRRGSNGRIQTERNDRSRAQREESIPQQERPTGHTTRKRDVTLDTTYRTVSSRRRCKPARQPESLRRRKRPLIADRQIHLPPSSDGTQKDDVPRSGTNDPLQEDTSTAKGPSRRVFDSRTSSFQTHDNEYENDDDEDGKDAFDRIGARVADTLESFLWGADEDLSDDGENLERRPRKKTSSAKKTASKAHFWKDRMEENISFILGGHDDEASYDRWQRQLGGELGQRRLKRNSEQRKKNDKANNSFWREDSSLMSLLLGRKPRGAPLQWDGFFGEEMGTNFLTSFLKTILKCGLLVAGYTCRWASVRGAVPQPVVVLGVSSAAICARPRRRLQVAVFTLLTIRTIGEFIHGYVNGNGDWDEDCVIYGGFRSDNRDDEDS